MTEFLILTRMRKTSLGSCRVDIEPRLHAEELGFQPPPSFLRLCCLTVFVEPSAPKPDCPASDVGLRPDRAGAATGWHASHHTHSRAITRKSSISCR